MSNSASRIPKQEKKIYWNLNLAISLMADLLNLNSAYYYYYIFRNLSMTVYIIGIQKSALANILITSESDR